MPIVGPIPVCPTLRARTKPATMAENEWLEGRSARNRSAIERVERFRASELGAECWRKSLSDVESGWLSIPAPLDAATAGTVHLTPRYAIYEQHGSGPRKVRIVDILQASCVDAITSAKDTAAPDSLDVFLAITSYYRLVRPGCQLRAASSDFFHAYKNAGTPCDGGKYSTALHGPPAGSLMTARLCTQPFGSTRAPANWARVTALTQWIPIKYFWIYLPIYVGDCFLVEPSETGLVAYRCVDFLSKLCGFKLGIFSVPSFPMLLLGALVTITPEFASASLPLERRDALISDIREILRSGNWTPGQAANLRGRLGLAQSMLCGKFGWVLLQPITNRQYSRALKGSRR